MLEIFMQSVVLGTLLATTYFLVSGVIRRAARRRLGALADGAPLRVVQPQDVLGH